MIESQDQIKLGDQRELAAWRKMLMPFALIIIFSTAAYFFVVSNMQFNDIKSSIELSSVDDTLAMAVKEYKDSTSVNSDLDRKVQILMKERAQRADISRASAGLLLSLWTRNMGFVTGMILAIVGAVFVLSRIDDIGTELSAEHGLLKGSLQTSSPGIVLAILGTGLMIMAMTIRYTESGKDISQPANVAASSQDPTTALIPEGISTETQEDLREETDLPVGIDQELVN